MIVIFFLLLGVTIIMGIPISFSLIATSLVYLWLIGFPELGIVSQRMVSGVDSFPLLALPFFILAGRIMSFGTTQRLMDLANTLFGHIRGGLAASGIGAGALFGSISGSGVATAAAVGSIIQPEMIRKSYPKGFGASIIAASGALGIVLPPSLAMVVFGVAAGVSIADLFLAGIIPGFFLNFLLIMYAIWISKKKDFPKEDSNMSLSQVFLSFRRALLPLFMPIIILGGIMSGFFTPTESAVIAVVYALFLSLIVYRTLKFSDIPKVLIESARDSAVILFIISAATPFGWVMATQQIPVAVTDWITSTTSNTITLTLLILLVILILGTFMETISVIIITTPMFMPLVADIGLDPVHFGIILIVGLAIGGVTPPLAVNLFVTTRIANIQVEKTFPYVIHVVAVLILGWLIVTFMPQVSLWIPNTF